MATFNGSLQINSISDAEMVKIYSFKERHGAVLNFNLSTASNGPTMYINWTKLEGAEALITLLKELTAKQ